MSDWRSYEARWDGNDVRVKVDGREKKISKKNLTFTGSLSFEDSPIDKAINDLKDNFCFSDFHEERVRKLLENDNSLTDDLNHLVIAASVMLSDAAQMKSGGLRAHEMGDKIIIEEKADEEWNVVRTVGVQVAQILAHARAKKRVEELEGLVGGLGNDRTDRIFDLDEPSYDPFDFDGVDDSIGYDPYRKKPDNSPFGDVRWVGENSTYGWGSGTTSTTSVDSPEDMERAIKELKGDNIDALHYSLLG